ncbi:glycosyltransferase [Serratia sp. root2]|uniref:glycosyltransferase n=1 Tax=Serratia sp. root2 TaxID=3059676 RepID=UPI00288EC510|nr:glycosyltransferase [Serratia sp. root2]MDT3253214.1 glycosyltransferase [Serratia sp. root2]
MNKTGISALIIVCNAENSILRTIDSIIDVTDEIVIVDTGSVDNTLDIIPKENSKIKTYNHRWDDDFSKSRNYAIELASGPYCFVIDADEYLAEESRKGFRENIYSLFDGQELTLYSPTIDNMNGSILRNNARIFMKRPSLRYKGFVHEYLFEDNYNIKHAPEIIINHTGYLEYRNLEGKRKRNLQLLKRQLDEAPTELRWKYFMLRYLDLNDKQFEDILDEFGKVPLPYSHDIEVYALNVKSRLIIYLLDKSDFYEAYRHADELLKFYKDKNSCLLHFISLYLMSTQRYHNDMLHLEKIHSNIDNYQQDEFITETIDEQAVSSIMNKFLRDIDFII